LKDKKSVLTEQDEKDINDSLAGEDNSTASIPDEVEEDALANVDVDNELSNLYGPKYANAGTEEINQEDLNTPTLKVVQDNTKNLPDKRVGYYFRSDTGEQLPEVYVNFVSVTTKEQENYNKDGIEKVKVYFGFYQGTNEPFKFYMRGAALGTHRKFQSELVTYKNRMKIPMFALTVRLSTTQVTGKTEKGVEYDVRRPVFDVVKTTGKPEVERDPDRIGFLLEAVERFKQQAQTVEVENDREPF
jgi:hypothetical protein